MYMFGVPPATLATTGIALQGNIWCGLPAGHSMHWWKGGPSAAKWKLITFVVASSVYKELASVFKALKAGSRSTADEASKTILLRKSYLLNCFTT